MAPLTALFQRILNDPVLADPDEEEGFQAVAAAEILATLCERINTTPPPVQLVTDCRDLCLQRWDAGIDALDPAPGYKEERRAMIEATFNRLLEVCRKWDAL